MAEGFPDYSMMAAAMQGVKPGTSITQWNTDLGPQEQAFRDWVKNKNVPFDPKQGVTDYDMRGFYKALMANDPRARSAIDPNDQRLHYPDYWKTPIHETFSNQSQWATPSAPHWNGLDQLISAAGKVMFDDRNRRSPK